MAGPDTSQVGNVRGDGELLLFSVFDIDVKPRSRLVRAPSDETMRAFGGYGVQALSVDGSRIVVGVRKGYVEVLDTKGKLLRTLDVRVSDISAAMLAGSTLVVQRGRSLSVYDVRTGAREREWRIEKGLLADVHGGVAVYLTETAVHLVRLADGRDVVFSTPTKGRGEGPLRAQLEAAGLIYSFVNDTRAKPGHVVFVPFSRLREHLR